jgi:hypothetical protein
VLVAAALHDIIGEVDNIASGMPVAAQQILQGVVKQIRGVDVDLQHAGERFAERRTGLFRLPCAGVMDDCPQTIGGGFHFSAKARMPSSVEKSA